MIDWPALLFHVQSASASARKERSPAPQADARARVDRSLALLDRDFAEPLDLARIAQAAAFSPYHFHRVFQREVGETPQHYLTRRRIQRARELLIQTDLPVTEVCLAVGFSSLGSFSTLFRRHTGQAPSRYRRLVVQSLGVPGPAPKLAPIPGCFLRAFAGTSARSEKTGSPPRG